MHESDELSVAAAAKWFERRFNRRTSICTVYRYMARGSRGVRLAFSQVGGSRRISVAAIEEFVRRLSTRGQQPEPATDPRYDARQRRAAEYLDKALGPA